MSVSGIFAIVIDAIFNAITWLFEFIIGLITWILKSIYIIVITPIAIVIAIIALLGFPFVLPELQNSFLNQQIVTDDYLADCGVAEVIFLPEKDFEEAGGYSRVFQNCTFDEYTQLTEDITEYFKGLDYSVYTMNEDKRLLYPVENYTSEDFVKSDTEWKLAYEYNTQRLYVYVKYNEEDSTITVKLANVNGDTVLDMLASRKYKIDSDVENPDVDVDDPVPVG